MKLKNITSIAIITITATLLTGCQDQLKQNLTNCQQENTELKAKIESQKQELIKKDNAVQSSSMLIAKTLVENEKLRRQVAAMKKALESKSNTEGPAKKPEMTPEQKENIRKGIEELRRLQKESAEKMKLERLKKEGKK